MAPICDVVIPTRNRREQLTRCLAGLEQQEFRDFRVIIVDDASDEPVESFLEPRWFKVLDLKVVRLAQNVGPGAARNIGAAAGDAEFIAFVDDDVYADAKLLSTHLHGLLSAGAVPTVSCGPFMAPPDWKPTPWNLWEARQAKKEAENLTQGVFGCSWRQFHTGNNCLRRSLFTSAGGFDEQFLRAEDDEFALRLHDRGTHFIFQPEAIAWHYSERSLRSWRRIPEAYAQFDVLIDRMYPSERYLRRKQNELERRHPLMRWFRRLTVRPVWVRRTAILASTTGARLMFAVRATPLAMMALSAAWDLAYAGALLDEIHESAEASAPAWE